MDEDGDFVVLVFTLLLLLLILSSSLTIETVDGRVSPSFELDVELLFDKFDIELRSLEERTVLEVEAADGMLECIFDGEVEPLNGAI